MQADPHSVHYETRRPIHMYPYPYPYILHSSMCWPNNKRFTLLSRWNAGYAKCGNKWSKRAINLLHHHGFGSSVALQPLVCSVFAGRLWNGLWIDWEMNPSLAALSSWLHTRRAETFRHGHERLYFIAVTDLLSFLIKNLRQPLCRRLEVERRCPC